MTLLAKEYWLVAFYLSKYGNTIQGKETAPPVELHTKSWKEAYKFFHEKFSEGKTVQTFENSLKNCRDTFDGHIDNSSRKGWRDLERKPIKLPALAKNVFNKYSSVSREAVWDELKGMLSMQENKTVKHKETKKDLFNQKQMKNPTWNREELILALDLYFKMDYGQMHGTNPDIIQLSKDLRSLNIHTDIPNKENFRSVNSVALKLANLKKSDQNFKGKGMRDGGKLEKEIWNQYHRHRDTLKKEADIIRQLYLKPKAEKKSIVAERKVNYKSEFLFQFHKNRETDPLVIKVKKEMVLSNSKSLRCEVCGFDSVSFYGELGNDLMEIHYNKELKSEPGLESSSMEDFIIVCSNCHKALDKNFALLNADDLKKIIRKK